MVRIWKRFLYWVYEELAGSRGNYLEALYWAWRRQELKSESFSNR